MAFHSPNPPVDNHGANTDTLADTTAIPTLFLLSFTTPRTSSSSSSRVNITSSSRRKSRFHATIVTAIAGAALTIGIFTVGWAST
ncbi:hypothetical protein FS842_005631, partial [Serendipita sp. 407]